MNWTIGNWVFGTIVVIGTLVLAGQYFLLVWQDRLNKESRALCNKMAETADRLDRHKGTIPIRIVTEHDGTTRLS